MKLGGFQWVLPSPEAVAEVCLYLLCRRQRNSELWNAKECVEEAEFRVLSNQSQIPTMRQVE